MIKWTCFILLLCFCFASPAQDNNGVYMQVLGVAQDGGYPHMGCQKKCCTMAWENDSMKRNVVSLALVDSVNRKWWLFEATPDIKEQLHYFQTLTKGRYNFLPEGIFITHAHIGHYTGLMELGKEVMSTNNVRVYVLPKMKTFLESNGPWSQLVTQHNIELVPLIAERNVDLTETITVMAFTVPHRDEYSETAGFRIHTGHKRYLFVPDINKWDKWNRDIIREVQSVNVALIDGTFFNDTELPERNMANVPHPLVMETMHLFEKEDNDTKSRIYFIHFNHTNPLLWDAAKQDEVKKAGFNIAIQGGRY
jgi:pyrroloquinoline quinone biosynthesis protein B